LQELERVQEDPFLSSYYLFHATRAELFSELNLLEESIKGLQKAIQLAPMQAEKKLLQKKLDDCLEKTLKFDGK